MGRKSLPTKEARRIARTRWKDVDEAQRSAFASLIGSAPRPGRRVMRACPDCGAELSAREMREHRARCPKR